MGFHTCPWCAAEGTLQREHAFLLRSSADVIIHGGTDSFQFPHQGLLHYVTSHGYQPPAEFVNVVMDGTLYNEDVRNSFRQVKPVGYLVYSEKMPTGTVPEGFVEKLVALIKEVKSNYPWDFIQTRG